MVVLTIRYHSHYFDNSKTNVSMSLGVLYESLHLEKKLQFKSILKPVILFTFKDSEKRPTQQSKQQFI